MPNHRDRAVQLLVNYFEAIAKAAGMRWEADYTTEIEEAVDAIIDAAEDKTIETVQESIVKPEAQR